MTERPHISRRTIVTGLALAVPTLALRPFGGSRRADPAPPEPSVSTFPFLTNPRTPPSAISPIRAISLTPESSYSGIVPLTAQFDLGLGIPSSVTISLGRTTRSMTRIGGTDIWQAEPWDTRIKLRVESEVSPSNFCAWVQVRATYQSGINLSSALFPVYTANYSYGDLPDRESSPPLPWAADYSSMDAWLASFTSTVYGSSYASLVDDPVRGGSRKAIKVTLPDRARFDRYQPTSSPRFQAAQPTAPPWGGISEGQVFYVGFAVYVPTTNSSAIGSGGFPTVNISDALQTNQHIAIFQMFGPQARTPSYPSGRGAITIIDANRNSDAEPADRFHIDANQLNGGDPGLLVDFGYNRGAWTDIVLGIKMSADIRRGWIEVYLNQGEHTSVQPVPLFGGKTRLPRVTAWPHWSSPAVPSSFDDGRAVTGGSHDHRTDMQIYRAAKTYDEVTLLHTGHRIGPTPESVDPRSYA